MTSEQRYLFDVNGYLHIPDVLSETELAAREAVERYLTMSEEELPEGFSHSEDAKMHANGFAWNRSLESLVVHPKLWPIKPLKLTLVAAISSLFLGGRSRVDLWNESQMVTFVLTSG